ncbi:MAG: flavodoxin family protein [Rickettsiaceae bacterium]
MTNPIIIIGSSRSHGETRKAVDLIVGSHNIPTIDLKTLNISIYDYEHQNKNDDFIPLMEGIMEHDLIVLATPVYWYTMSATMKIFLDRLTDLFEIRKDLGRKLCGKKLFIISTVGKTSLPQGFEDAFWQTAKYLNMEYEGCSFICSDNNNNIEAKRFKEIEVEKARNILFRKQIRK